MRINVVAVDIRLACDDGVNQLVAVEGQTVFDLLEIIVQDGPKEGGHVGVETEIRKSMGGRTRVVRPPLNAQIGLGGRDEARLRLLSGAVLDGPVDLTENIHHGHEADVLILHDLIR